MRNNFLLKIILWLVTISIIILLIPSQTKNDNEIRNDLSRAVVTEVVASDNPKIQKIKVMVKEGEYKGQEFIVDNTLIVSNKVLTLKPRDEVVLIINESQITTYQYVRENKLLLLVITFIILVILVGGMKGISALFSVGFTIAVVALIFIPRLLSGDNPITVTIICSVIIAFVSLIIQHGFSKKAFASLIGTLGGLAIAGLVTVFMSNSLQVTINSEEAMDILRISQDVTFNFQHLLFASIVIGALGANIDMSMSVATAMNEIKDSNPNISKKMLIKSGMNVGRDVIGTMSNTLILAYVGSAIGTLMIFFGFNIDLSYIMNLQDISMEILRSLAGSMGIIFCVPLTVYTRALME